MDMRSINHSARVSQWRDLIAQCRRSSKSVKDWCAENSVLTSKYYYWLRVIRNEALVLANDQAPPLMSKSQFAELKVTENNNMYSNESNPNTHKNSICAVLESDTFSLKINNGADTDLLLRNNHRSVLLRLLNLNCSKRLIPNFLFSF